MILEPRVPCDERWPLESGAAAAWPDSVARPAGASWGPCSSQRPGLGRASRPPDSGPALELCHRRGRAG